MIGPEIGGSIEEFSSFPCPCFWFSFLICQILYLFGSVFVTLVTQKTTVKYSVSIHNNLSLHWLSDSPSLSLSLQMGVTLILVRTELRVW